MKLTKRLLSMLLVLCMAFSMLPAMGLTASAANVTSGFTAAPAGTYNKVTDVSTLATGDTIIIVYESGNRAMSTTQKSNNRGYTAVTISNNSITLADGNTVQGVVLQSSGDTSYPFLLYTGNGWLQASSYASGKDNNLRTVDTNAASNGAFWKFADGTIEAQGAGTRRYLRYNDNNSIFSCYASGGQKAIAFYKLAGGSSTTTYAVNLNQTPGGTISATPASAAAGDTVTLSYTLNSGYSFGGWFVMDGDAKEVTVTDNTFTMPASDVEVEATFNEVVLNNYTVTYHSAGSVYGTDTVVEGNAIGADNLPTPTVDGWTFIGWSTEEIPTAQDSEPALYAGTETVTSNLNLYAVYAQESTGGSGGTIKLKLNDTTYVGARSGSDDYMSVATTEADAAEFRLESTGTDGEYYIYDVTDGLYIGWKSSTSMAFSSSTSASYIWVYDEAAGTFLNKSSGTRYLGYNSGSSKFSTYVSSYPHEFTVLGGTSYSNYTTNPGTMYTITWMANGAEYQKDTVAANSAVTAPAVEPTMDDTASNYFDFAGWSATDGGEVLASFPNATANVTYYAVFATHTFTTVNWVVEGMTVATENYRAGETPIYKGETPIKASDDTYSYTFSGWNPEITAVSEEGVTITYTAVFTATEITYVASLSIGSSTLKVTKTRTATSTLTRDGVGITDVTWVYSSSNPAVATINASTGVITALTVGTTDITVTYTVGGKDYTATQTLTVIENTSSGGYTLITQDNVPTDWSGDYIIMGKTRGNLESANTWRILTPNYDSGSAVIASNYEDAAVVNLSDADGIGTGTIADSGNLNSGVDKTIEMEDTGLVADTNGDKSILVYDTITQIDDAYAFTIECIDDITQIYTIRVKDTNLYIACSASTTTDNNNLNFDTSATELAQWQFSIDRHTETGYFNDIVTAQNVGNPTRRLYFNAGGKGQFRDYNQGAFTGKIGKTANNEITENYSLYLFGNPNPFKAQIYYHGDQITLVDTGKINANATSAQLVGALTPDIDGYPNWTLVGDPEWEIVENSTGNNMTVDSATGLITTNASTVGSYALVKVTYTIYDEINKVNQLVSTTAKVEVIAADTTYSTVIYETYSGTDTEVQYTVPNSMTTLPLAAYVVNDTTDDNSKTGSVVMGGTLAWEATISSGGGGSNATVSIDNDGTLHMANFASDAIITVTVTGATVDNIAASSATYKVYVKTAEYTLTVVPTTDSQGTYDSASDILTVASGESSAHLTYNVVDGDGNGPSATTFTLAGYAWTLSGDTYGAMINSSGLLDFTGMDRSEDRTITAVVSRVAATDVATGVTKSNLTDTITIVVKAQTVQEVLEAVNDTVIIDWALPVTFNVLTNDNYNVTVSIAADTLPTGVSANGDGSFTYTPSGWQTTDQTFTYTLSGTVDGVATTSSATVTLKTADSIYYEDIYSGIFTFNGNWVDVTDGTLVAEQTSSLDTADAFEYDANHAEYAMYSGGTAKMVTLNKGDNATVTFSFAGTGFDIISATTNNTGAIMLTVKDAGGAVVTDPNTGRKLAQIIDIFRGYTYVKEGYTRYGLEKVTRYKLESESYIPDAAGNYYYDVKTATFIENNVWYTPAENVIDKYYDSANQFESMQDVNGTYVLKEYTSNWQPSTGENSDGNYYQIPILKVTDLPYGTYTVTVKPTYSAAYDRQGDGSYDFIFDGVRIHNPVAGREAEYKYISLRDAVKEAGFGSGTVVACDHVGQEWSDWTFYSRARNTNSATTCNRGSFVQYCNYCGGVANTAYFHVNITADDTELGVGGYNALPATTMLHYTLTADECGDAAVQASIQAKLDAITGTLTEYWSSNTRDILTCMNNANVVIANGAGTTYATLQLKDPATQTIYASAIHSPMITVSADETHTHTFGEWVHDANSDPSTHTHTCTAETCSYYETEACVFTSEVTTQPTQTTEGVTTYTCTGCGYSYTESIPALGGYTATFHVPEGATAPGALTGDSVTMPAAVEAPAAYDAHSYTFIGWLGNSLSDTTAAQTYYEAGAVIDLSSDMEFYALYTYGAAGEGSGYSLSTTVPVHGDSIIVAALDGNTYKALSVSGSTVSASALTVSGSTITSATDGLTWTVADDTYSSYTGLSLSNDSGYLHMNSSALKTSSDKTNGVFEFTANGVGTFLMKGLANTRWLSYSTAFGVASAENDAAPIYIFKAASATTYFTTELAKACQHANTTTVTVDAACLTDGSVTVTCNDCGKTVSVTVLPALGHDYQVTSVVGNVTTYTCSRCHDSYTESSDYAVSYIMQDGVTYSGNSRDGNSITLPTAVSIPSTYNAQTYTLVGWATETSADSETAPTYYAPGAEVTIQDDTVFYPLYSFGGSSGSGYQLVSSANDFTAGTYYLAALSDSTYYFVNGEYVSAGISVETTGLATANVTNGLLAASDVPSGAVALTVTADSNNSGYYFIANGSSYLYATSAKTSLTWSTTYTTESFKPNFTQKTTDGCVLTGLSGSKVSQNGSTKASFIRNYASSSDYYNDIYFFKQTGSGSGTTTYTFTLQAAVLTDNYVVTVTPASLMMPLDSTASLSVVLTNNGTVVAAESIVFTSDNENIVVVDETGGLLSGSTAGNATITVEVLASDGNVYTATCQITVAEQSTDVTVNYIGTETGRVYNWGTRDTVATFLTAPAAAYYTESYSYATLSALTGDSRTDTSFYTSALGTAIHNMLEAKQTSITSYDGTKPMYAYTDCIGSDTEHISSYYSAKQITSTWNGTIWNREPPGRTAREPAEMMKTTS